MEIILKQDIDKLGKVGEVVEVKDGYARNFLLPKGLGLRANATNLKVVEREKQKALLRLEQEKTEAQALAEKINATSCTVSVEAGQDGKLFGSVTTQDIAQAYKAEGINLDKRKIELEQPIKEVGVFKISIKIHPELNVQAKVWVVKQ